MPLDTTSRAQDVHYENVSATLLSLQEPTPAKPQAEPEWWNELRIHLENTISAVRNWRNSWWMENWSDLAQFIQPRRSIWMTQSTGGQPTPNNMSRGREINTAIVDPTATQAVRVCSGGLMSGLASPSRPWFKIAPVQKKTALDAAARDWVDETQDRMETVIGKSNFYNSFAIECEDNVVFGTAPNIIYEDDADVFRIYNPCVGEYFLTTGAALRVNGLYRLFVFSVMQIVDFFGIDDCPVEVATAWKAKGAELQKEFLVAHAIEPNYGVGPNNIGVVPGKFTWRESYWLWGMATPGPLSHRGFVEQPFTAPRWSTQSNDAYGRSPGMDVLPDVKQLQIMTRRKAEGIEKQVRPPLVADMSMKNQPASSLPGHITYVAQLGPNTGIRSMYETNFDLSALIVDIEKIEQRIQKGLFVDLFLMLEQQVGKMTAYEVAQKMLEKMQVLGPVIENLIGESLEPKLKRIFSIMRRKGLIDPPPPSLQGVPLKFEFVSMLALAQKAAATGGIERMLALVGNMEAVFPAAKDNVDADATIREYNDLLGNPADILFSPEQVMARRQSDAQAAAQQRQQQGVLAAAQAAGQAAPAAQVLANVKTGGGENALGAMIGGGGSQ